ncbi:MAG: hypothetical protein LC640_04660, partial [Frankia sp.]|nr:hypothetical protein [Frankia sp.]
MVARSERVRSALLVAALVAVVACETPQRIAAPIATPSEATAVPTSSTASPSASAVTRASAPVTFAFGGDVNFEGVLDYQLRHEPASIL